MYLSYMIIVSDDVSIIRVSINYKCIYSNLWVYEWYFDDINYVSDYVSIIFYNNLEILDIQHISTINFASCTYVILWMVAKSSVGGKHLLQKLVKCEFHGIFMRYEWNLGSYQRYETYWVNVNHGTYNPLSMGISGS